MVTKAELLRWSWLQGTNIQPPPPPPPTSQILITDSRMLHAESADRLFSWHSSSITFIGGASVTGRKLNAVSETAGVVDGKGNLVFSKYFGDPSNEGVNRNWFQIQIGDGCERYVPGNPNSDSIRCGTAGPYSTIIQPGMDVWQMISFVLDPSLYVDMAAPNAGDTSISGFHQAVGTTQTGLTPMTLMADPQSSTGITIKWRPRRWEPPGTLNPSGTPRSIDRVLLNNYPAANKRITIITHWRMGYQVSHDPWLEGYVQVNGAWLNNSSNPVFTHNGFWVDAQNPLTGRALGYNISPYSHQTRLFALYCWAIQSVNSPALRAVAFPQSVNNIPGPGQRGWRAWYRGGCVIRGVASAQGEAPVNQFTLAALANAANI